jgi:hypothetical protein
MGSTAVADFGISILLSAPIYTLTQNQLAQVYVDTQGLRQRSKVCAATPSTRASSATGALSGGSIRATARSLKACPYRAIFVPHHRPRIIGSYRGDNNSDAGGTR